MASKYELEKLNGSNFSLWKLKIKTILRNDNFLAAIKGKPIELIDDRWKEMDDNVVANLHLTMADSILSSIVEKKTAKEIWDLLIILYKETLYSSDEECTSVTDQINNLNTLFSELTSTTFKIMENERVELLLHSLPDSYDQLVINNTNNNVSNYLSFDDVDRAVLED
ncbi:hypothetical protein Lal_00037621 [Lupinus albus]|nr:hypothetical protein Lal_00037621 [Lupinus albus]